MLSWIFFAIIAGISSAAFNTLLRRSLRRPDADPTAYAWWFEAVRALVCLLLIPFLPLTAFSWQLFGTLLLLGLSEFVTICFYMKMHAYNQLSLSTVIAQLRSVWVPFLAFFILGEVLIPTQWLGIALIVSGAIIATGIRQFRVDRGVKYALIVTFASAFSGVILKQAAGMASIPVVVFAFSFPAVILLPLFMKSGVSRIQAKLTSVVSHNLPASAVNLIGMFALTMAARLGTASQVTGVFQGVAMLAVASGIILLGEKENQGVKILAACLTTVGIILLV